MEINFGISSKSYGVTTYEVEKKTYLSEAYVYADYYTYDSKEKDTTAINEGQNCWGVQVTLNAGDTYYDSIYPAPYGTSTNIDGRQYIGFTNNFKDGSTQLSGLGYLTEKAPDQSYNGTNLSYLESGTVESWKSLKNTFTGIFVYGRDSKARVLKDGDQSAGRTGSDPYTTLTSKEIYNYITEEGSPVVTTQAEWYVNINNASGWDYNYYYNGRRLYGSVVSMVTTDYLLSTQDVCSTASKFRGKEYGLGNPDDKDKKTGVLKDNYLFGSGRLWNGVPSQNGDGSNIPVNSNFTVGGDTLTLNYVGDRQYVCTKTTPNAAKTGTLTQTLFVTKANGNYAVIDYYINDIRSQYGKAAYFDSGKNRIYNKSGKLVRNLSELVGNRYYTPGGNYADYLFELNDGEHDGTVIQLVATGSDNASTNPTKPTSFTGYLWEYDAEKCTIKDYGGATKGDGTASQVFTADADGNITYHLVVNSDGVYYNGTTKRFYSVADASEQKEGTQIDHLDNLASNWDTMDENSSLSGKTTDKATSFTLTKHSLNYDADNSFDYYTCEVDGSKVFVADAEGNINYDVVNAVLTMQVTTSDEEGNEVKNTVYYYSGKFYKSYKPIVEDGKTILHLVRAVNGKDTDFYFYNGVQYDSEKDAKEAANGS